jgi:hypothetical protein
MDQEKFLTSQLLNFVQELLYMITAHWKIAHFVICIENTEEYLDAVMSLEFRTVESLWWEFWSSKDNNSAD